MNDVGLCCECGGDEWIIDNHTGDTICVGCGVCDSRRVMVVAESYRATFSEDGTRHPEARVQEALPDGPIVTTMALEQAVENACNTSSPPYKRQTYFSERISQWRMLEPTINADDMRSIQREWERLTGRFNSKPDPYFADSKWYWDAGPPEVFMSTHVLTKEGCRKLLWHIDNRRKAHGLQPYFVKKYLEKYFSIRKELCHMDSLGVKVSGDLLIFLRERFAMLQVPFDTIVRHEGVRYSFPNYNFCLRRLFDLYGAGDCCWDFPPLKSKKKREDIVCMWLKLVTFLRWPYINSDGKRWGRTYEADIVALRKRRKQRQAANTRRSNKSTERAYADDSNSKLRRGVADGESKTTLSTELWHEAFVDFPASFLCPPVCDHNWDRYDDSHTFRQSTI